MYLINKTVLTISLTIFLSVAALGQKKNPISAEVKKTSDISNATQESLSYLLPKTAIRVEIESEKTIKKTGPYYRYSQRFLNLAEVITEDSEEWAIKGIKITAIGVPDENKRYSIFSTGNTSATMVNLTHDGILAGINNNDVNTKSNICQKKKKCDNPSLSDINFDNIPLHEDLLYKTSTAAMAQEAANMIYKIRNNRIDLLSGELENLPPDGKAYKTVLEELNKLEKDFVSLFSGKKISFTKKETFLVIPDPISSYNNHVICRFSKQKGIVDPMDITGTPIYFKLNAATFKKLENKATEPNKNPIKNGLFYCLPGTASIQIIDKNKEISSKNVSLAQYGQVVSMPASILEQEKVVIKICPVTGALISIQ
ncbi:DUF4831 family protein [Plebeiibacterium marinum]|uniref:DUF4831 family protein n=1 Tax=Plebeiibacterium marinum TaxID=2992111 RepID=A0AAE3MDR2_9BACT|nr:DUF4831 family protein [Plebeiobacterium marinum]MCW3805991.1 DUF4831 family protein [Plebeiobacterium marinum]